MRAVSYAFTCVYYTAIVRKRNKIHVCSPNSTGCKKEPFKSASLKNHKTFTGDDIIKQFIFTLGIYKGTIIIL